MPLLVALDVEASGRDVAKHGVVSVGLCAGDMAGDVKLKRRYDVCLPPGRVFEERCKREHWDKCPDLLAKFQEDAKSPHDAFVALRNDLDWLDKEHGGLLLLTDNRIFDIKWVDYCLAHYASAPPLSFDTKGNYRPICDTDSYARGALGLGHEEPWLSDSVVVKTFGIEMPADVVHDHSPENDAHWVYELHRRLVLAIREKRERDTGKAIARRGLMRSLVLDTFGIEMSADVVLDHSPENDAHWICELHRRLVLKIRGESAKAELKIRGESAKADAKAVEHRPLQQSQELDS